MYLEAFYRVLPLLVERVGAFFFLLAVLYAAATLFLWRRKRPLAVAKRRKFGWLPYSPKN